MFSGSAIIDKKNLTGLQRGNEPAILYFYTSAGNTSETSKGKPFTQCLAYSNDGGKTLIKYDKNPIIKNIIKENRDPKVIYCEADDSYIMVLFLDGHSFAILKSKICLIGRKYRKLHYPTMGNVPTFIRFAQTVTAKILNGYFQPPPTGIISARLTAINLLLKPNKKAEFR